MNVPRWPLPLLTCLVWHCAGTPQTEPPEFEPRFHADLTHLQPVKGRAVAIEVQGGPGAVEPGGAILHIVNLDSTAPEVTVPVEADGSFKTTVNVDTGNVLRFQVQNGDQRSPAVDLVFGGSSRPVEHALTCLTTKPESHWTFESLAAANIEVSNQCDQSVSLSGTNLRIEPSGFSVREAPTLIQAKGTATVVVDPPTGATANPEENILLIQIASPVADRRAITLIGPKQP